MSVIKRILLGEVMARVASDECLCIPEGVKDYFWLYRCECFYKLLIREFCVPIEVKPSHDSNQLMLKRLVAD